MVRGHYDRWPLARWWDQMINQQTWQRDDNVGHSGSGATRTSHQNDWYLETLNKKKGAWDRTIMSTSRKKCQWETGSPQRLIKLLNSDNPKTPTIPKLWDTAAVYFKLLNTKNVRITNNMLFLYPPMLQFISNKYIIYSNNYFGWW